MGPELDWDSDDEEIPNVKAQTPNTEVTSALPQRGFSVKEALNHAHEAATTAKQRQPADVLTELQRGNARFWTGVAHRPEMSPFERRALIMQQWPTTAVLGCADSRVPVEIVFDQGLGDIFTVRV